MVEGYFLAGAAQVPLRSVALTHFDGRGNVSQVDHAVVDGMTPPVDWAPATGTYNVNPDCTGESELNIPGNPLSPLSIRFVIADDGNLFRVRAIRAGTAITEQGHTALEEMNHARGTGEPAARRRRSTASPGTST